MPLGILPTSIRLASHMVKRAATPKAAKQKPLTAAQRLEAYGIEAVCERLAAGEGQGEIADSLNVGRGHFSMWIADDAERLARAKSARVASARLWDERAVKAIEALDDDSKPGSVAKARELAQHYRWRAKCYNPRDYGDKVALAGDAENPVRVVSAHMTDDQLAAIASGAIKP